VDTRVPVRDDGPVSGLAGELRAILRVVAGVVVLLAVMLVFGWVCELVRFGAVFQNGRPAGS